MLIRLSIKLGVSIFGLICLYLLTFSAVYAGESPYKLCANQPVTNAESETQELDPEAPAEFTADRAKRNEQGIATLEGNVQMNRGPQSVTADRVTYDEENKIIHATGNVHAEDNELVIESSEAELHLNSDYAQSENATYQYKPAHARGEAEKIERTSKDFVRLENLTYTTCDVDDQSWEMSANEVTLDNESGAGIGKNVVVKFKSVPIFYTPWIRFPVDDQRKTGFLVPKVGNTSDSGFELETPWYWNIAPNRDAIIAPRLLADRGLQLKSNLRYLNETSFGQLGGEYLDDNEFDDDRYLITFEHKKFFSNRIDVDLLYNKTSDENYFEDLGDALGLTSTQNIERRADFNYRGDNWNFLTRAQQFQVVDDSLLDEDEPFKILPQIQLDGTYFNLPGGLNLFSMNQWTSFEHDDQIDGNRLHFGIELERPIERTAYFIRPGISFRHTEYDLNRDDGEDDRPSRSIPSAHLDAGLIFERDLENSNLMQTFEPRVYYLHTPFEDQDDIPIFDTAEYEFGFDQLFRDNRFSGFDRIEDADRLSVGLTTRILDVEDGNEKLRASIGRIFYFRDRNVTLPDGSIENEESSEIAAELKIGLTERWDAISTVLYDTHDDHTERTSQRLQYRSPNNLIFNVGYSYRRRDIEPIDPFTNERESLEQSDISIVWPITDKWRAVSRWNYDLNEKRNLELLGGIEYDTCCWKFRVAARRFNQNTDQDHNDSIQFQLVLKGLGQVGSPIGDLLERGIRGYDDQDDEYLY